MTPVLVAEVGVEVEGWQAAVRAACRLLEAGGAVEARYVDRCVAVVTEHGPYIVVAPGIALAHARPEDGAVALGLAVITCAEPVAFGHPDNDPVDLVFAFASPDRDQHIELLGSLAEGIGGGLDRRLRESADAAEAEALLGEVLARV